MNVTDRILASVIDHWALVLAIGVSIWWVLKTFGPRAVKMSLENGGGEVITRHLEVALLRQDARIGEQMRSLIQAHEQVEARNMKESLSQVRGDITRDIDDLSERLTRIESRRWF